MPYHLTLSQKVVEKEIVSVGFPTTIMTKPPKNIRSKSKFFLISRHSVGTFSSFFSQKLNHNNRTLFYD